MKIIATIKDKDLGIDSQDLPVYEKEREAARAVVFDEDGKIAVLHSEKLNYYKLPGGGIEKDESALEAVEREMKEEIGCELENVKELGVIEEFRNQFSLRQLSYCFVAQVKGEKGIPQLEPDELEEGLETVWLDISGAIKMVRENEDLEHYGSRFVTKRDLVFLEAVKDLRE